MVFPQHVSHLHFLWSFSLFSVTFFTLHLHFRLSLFPMESNFLSACVYLFLSGFLVYRSGQEAIVGGIPGSAVIDYGLSSFIAALLSCITQGYFVSSLGTHLSGHFFRNDLGVCRCCHSVIQPSLQSDSNIYLFCFLLPCVLILVLH